MCLEGGCFEGDAVDAPAGDAQLRMHAGRTEDSTSSDAGSMPVDAASQDAECETARDCRLVPFGCCAPCDVTASAYFAVPEALATAARQEQCPSRSSCGACAAKPETYDPVIMPQCIEGRCQAVDLTHSDAARCDDGSTCGARPVGCCPCGNSLAEQVALREGAVLDLPYNCADALCPAVACPIEHLVEASCATDGYCELELISFTSWDGGSEDDAG
ncbi:MAG: hypothetical protein OEZ06_21680 [Myxococcales bacterium]|nr:hypothetical protein [Myxococcales bacterium]